MIKRLLIVSAAVFLLLALTSCGLKMGSYVSAGEKLINSREELHKMVEKSLTDGKTEISFETTKLNKDDFEYLNREHDGFYGRVSGYTIRSFKFLDKSYVTLSCEIYDNYYVEKAILEDKDIPEDRKEARKLLSVCRKLLPEIMKGDPSDYRKEKRIHDYLVSNTEYGYRDGDKGDDSRAYGSYGALVEKKAVCNGYAQAMKLLCDLTGVECEMISGTADGENHAWNLIKIGEGWYHVDTTWDDPEPDDPERIFYHYFNVNDDFIGIDHSWDREDYRAARGIDYNYFVLNDLKCKDFRQFRKKCQEIFEDETDENPNLLQIQVDDYDKDLYSEENLQFLFHQSGADSLNIQTVGKPPCVTLYIMLSY